MNGELLQDFRRAILIVLLFATALLGAAFAVMNFRTGNLVAAWSEVIMGTLAVAIVPAVMQTGRLLAWSLGYMTLFSITMMSILATPMSSPSVFAWVLILPIVSSLLLGRWLGTGFALVFVAISGAIYLNRYGADAAFGNPRGLLNVAGTAMCILGFSFVYETSRERNETALRRQARADPLTGLGNRLYLAEAFPACTEDAARNDEHLFVLVIDIDHFKTINDIHGHEAGDYALRWMADLLRDQMRESDPVCRHGGEEFCLLLRVTRAGDRNKVAEGIRSRVEECDLVFHGQVIPITISMGISDPVEPRNSLQDALAVADRRLYDAKRGGRNRVVNADSALRPVAVD